MPQAVPPIRFLETLTQNPATNHELFARLRDCRDCAAGKRVLKEGDDERIRTVIESARYTPWFQ